MRRKGIICFLQQDNEILLIHVDYGSGRIVWNGVSGYIDDGEDETASVLREVKEEIGVNIDESSLSYKGNQIISGDLELDIYTATKWDGTPSACEQSIKEVRWFEVDELPVGQMFPGTSDWIADIMK
jgi:NADH pyrophosphatase NudC (nudix superfamily)